MSFTFNSEEQMLKALIKKTNAKGDYNLGKEENGREGFE
jgi:hypothetical protein